MQVREVGGRDRAEMWLLILLWFTSNCMLCRQHDTLAKIVLSLVFHGGNKNLSKKLCLFPAGAYNVLHYL